MSRAKAFVWRGGQKYLDAFPTFSEPLAASLGELTDRLGWRLLGSGSWLILARGMAGLFWCTAVVGNAAAHFDAVFP
jgi:hypothetical protein